jgi:uncharacterized membrane protein YfcA
LGKPRKKNNTRNGMPSLKSKPGKNLLGGTSHKTRYPTKNSAGVVSFIVIFSSLFGVFGHMTSGGFDTPLILGTVVAVFVGATIGARSMVKIPGTYIKAGFGVVLWIFAIQLILKLMHIV